MKPKNRTKSERIRTSPTKNRTKTEHHTKYPHQSTILNSCQDTFYNIIHTKMQNAHFYHLYLCKTEQKANSRASLSRQLSAKNVPKKRQCCKKINKVPPYRLCSTPVKPNKLWNFFYNMENSVVKWPLFLPKFSKMAIFSPPLFHPC